MDDALSSLASQTSALRQQASLQTFKDNQKVELQVATMASKMIPSNPGLGKIVDTQA